MKICGADLQNLPQFIGGQIVGDEGAGRTTGVLREVRVEGRYISLVQDWVAQCTRPLTWEITDTEPTVVYRYRDGSPNSTYLTETSSILIVIALVGVVRIFLPGECPEDVRSVQSLLPTAS